MGTVAHIEQCSAPICSDTECKEVVWYPGEPICTKPSHIQRIQKKINSFVSKGTFKHCDTYFTGADLNKIKRVKPGLKGRVENGRVAKISARKPYRGRGVSLGTAFGLSLA